MSATYRESAKDVSSAPKFVCSQWKFSKATLRGCFKYFASAASNGVPARIACWNSRLNGCGRVGMWKFGCLTIETG